MAGPSLFDDFFSDEKEQEQELNVHAQEEAMPQSITDIKQQLKENYEKEANAELSQEKYAHCPEEKSESYEQSEKEQKNIVPNSESEPLLTTPQNTSHFQIEWTPVVPEFELNASSLKKKESEVGGVPKANEEGGTNITFEKSNDKHQKEPSLDLSQKRVAEDHFEVEWPDAEHVFLELPEYAPITDEKYSLEASALEMLEAHIESPSLTSEVPYENTNLNEEERYPDLLKETDENLTKQMLSSQLEVDTILGDDLNDDQNQKIPQHIKESSLPEWSLEDKYYPIGEVAKLFEVNLSHIRYWTNEFKLKPRTTRRGERLYNLADIQKLRMIYFLVKEQRHTIQGAKKHLRNNASAVVEQIELKASLLSFRQSLEAILKSLD